MKTSKQEIVKEVAERKPGDIELTTAGWIELVTAVISDLESNHIQEKLERFESTSHVDVGRLKMCEELREV